MASSADPAFLSQADFARRRKVSRKAVTDWKNKGYLVLADTGLVDVEKSEWALDQRPPTYRGGVTHRPVKSTGNTSGGNKQATDLRRAQVISKPDTTKAIDDEEGEQFDLNGSMLPLPLALQRKENFLGLQRKQDFEKGERALVDRGAAEKLLFETARDLRDAWTSWPSRIAITMADELKVDARALTTVLTAYVHQHLTELGEPHVDL